MTCVPRHAFVSALVLRIEREGYVPTRGDLEALLPRGERSPLFNRLLKVPLYPYQRAGAVFLARSGRALLADEMGLGKSIQAIAAAELLARASGVEREPGQTQKCLTPARVNSSTNAPTDMESASTRSSPDVAKRWPLSIGSITLHAVRRAPGAA